MAACRGDSDDLSMDFFEREIAASQMTRGDEISPEAVECEIIVEELAQYLVAEARKVEIRRNEQGSGEAVTLTMALENAAMENWKMEDKEKIDFTMEAMIKQATLGAVLLSRDMYTHLLNVPAKTETEALLNLVRSVYGGGHKKPMASCPDTDNAEKKSPLEAVASSSKGSVLIEDVEIITRWIADTLLTLAIAQSMNVPGATPVLEALREERLSQEIQEIIEDIVRYPVSRSLNMAHNVKCPLISTPWYHHLLAGIWTGLPEGLCKQSDTAKLAGLFDGIFNGLLETDLFQAHVSLIKALEVVFSRAKKSLQVTDFNLAPGLDREQFVAQEQALQDIIWNWGEQIYTGPYEINFAWVFCLAIGLMSQDALWCEHHCPFISVVNDVLSEDKRGSYVTVNNSGNLVLQSKGRMANFLRVVRLVCGCSRENVERI